MSLLAIYTSNVKRKKDEISRLKRDRVRYVNDISTASQKIVRLNNQLKNTKSQSSIRSKMNEISRDEKRVNDAQKKVADYDKKIAAKLLFLVPRVPCIYNTKSARISCSANIE